MITQNELKKHLHYDPDTGVFTWLRPTRNGPCGSKAGGVSHGYTQIGIKGTLYGAHRLAWLYVHGEHPKADIDHINRDKSDNRISNLREATRSENNTNTPARGKSGIKGVYWNITRNKWDVNARLNGVTHHLGRFTDLSAAKTAFGEFARAHHGEFYRAPA